jgi:CheY-like chemotaxis protein
MNDRDGHDLVVSSPATPQPAAPRSFRILIVEDNLDFAELLEQLLMDWGHSTALAADGATALARAGSFEPDVVFIDIGLPGMSGYEVAQALRTQSAAATKLVAVSGYGEREHRQRAEAVGFDRYLVKPIMEEPLAAVLASFRVEEAGQPHP